MIAILNKKTPSKGQGQTHVTKARPTSDRDWIVRNLEARVNELTHQLSEANRRERVEIEARKRMRLELLNACSTEQTRMGRDIHDGPQQSLTAILWKAQAVQMILENDGRQDMPELTQLTELIHATMAELHALARTCYPVELERRGLVSSLRALAVHSERLYPVRCIVTAETDEVPMEPQRAINAFRIVQESIHNAVKHGRASEIEIRICEREAGVEFAVADNGPGFDPTRVRSDGIGLCNMKYRADVIGGSIDFGRAADGRFSVVCTVPRARAS